MPSMAAGAETRMHPTGRDPSRHRVMIHPGVSRTYSYWHEQSRRRARHPFPQGGSKPNVRT